MLEQFVTKIMAIDFVRDTLRAKPEASKKSVKICFSENSTTRLVIGATGRRDIK